jgi:hypothetical protein
MLPSPMPVVVRSKESVCSPLIAVIAGSNPTDSKVVRVLYLLCA